MAIPQNQLEKFIKTIIDTKNNKKADIFNKQELKNIAFEMGFTEDEWEEYQEEIKKEMNAGRAFMKYDNTEDAIKHFEKAAKLDPYSLEVHAELANTYVKQYIKTKRKEDREKAIAHARTCLDIESSYTTAYEIISQLKRQPYIKSRKQAIILFLFLIIASATIVIIYTLSNKEEPTLAKAVEETQPETQEEVIVDEPELGIPVVFPENQNLKFEIESSDLNAYQDSYSYKMEAYIIPKGVSIEALTINVEALDKNGKVLFNDTDKTVRKNTITYRPNDVIPFMFLNYEKQSKTPEIAKIRLSIIKLDTEEAAKAYEASPVIKHTWAGGRPANYDVEFRQRSITVTSTNTNNTYHKLTLEAKNTGNLSIKKLQVEIIWKNNMDEELERKTAYFTTTSNPKIKRGQTFMFQGTYSIPTSSENIKEYTIKVVSLE